METEMQRGAIRDERRAYAKTLMARYPDLPIEQLDDLVRRFRKEASALDVGLISMDDEPNEHIPLCRYERLATRENELRARCADQSIRSSSSPEETTS